MTTAERTRIVTKIAFCTTCRYCKGREAPEQPGKLPKCEGCGHCYGHHYLCPNCGIALTSKTCRKCGEPQMFMTAETVNQGDST